MCKFLSFSCASEKCSSKGYICNTAKDSLRLINHHSRRHLAGNVRRQLSRLLFFTGLLPVDMRFQSLVKVGHAHASVDNGQHNQDECDDGKKCERSPGRKVFFEPVGLVHSNKLE